MTSSFLQQEFCVKGGVDVHRGVRVELVQVLDALCQIVLQGGEGGHDSGGAEAVCDEREVSEMSLNTGVQQGLGPGVAEGGPVLVQQVHQLITEESEMLIL